MIPAELRYTKEHEWVRLEGDVVTFGITDFAQDQLTDIVFVELPEVGRKVAAGDAVVVLESVKSVADVFAPCAGEIVDVNKALEAKPELVNASPYKDGWLAKVKAPGADLSSLMDATAYQGFLDSQEN